MNDSRPRRRDADTRPGRPNYNKIAGEAAWCRPPLLLPGVRRAGRPFRVSRPRPPRRRPCSAHRPTRRRNSARSAPFQKDAQPRGSSETSRRRSRGTNAASPPASAPAPASAWGGMGRRNSPAISNTFGPGARVLCLHPEPSIHPKSRCRAQHAVHSSDARLPASHHPLYTHNGQIA